MVTPEHLKFADQVMEGEPEPAPSYTRSLWFAIQATREINWVMVSGAAPKTTAWDTWLKLAHDNCKDAKWDAIGEKNQLMKEEARKTSRSTIVSVSAREECLMSETMCTYIVICGKYSMV
ncbi:hypothetical protein N7444_001628 [Penicillium canescens]|nr:hypothetical protein N7444_001628 [Penicillium canescens]